MSDEDDVWFPDFGPAPTRRSAEVLSVDAVMSGLRVVLFIPTPDDVASVPETPDASAT